MKSDNIKRQVILSKSAFVLTLLTLMVFVAIIAFVYRTSSEVAFILCCILISFFILVSLYYVPMSVNVTSDALTLNRSLGSKTIPIQNIDTIMPMSAPPDAIRLCGSGGFMGYWGWFKADSIGKYFAYYGKSADCFLVVLKDGRKYLMGCRDSEEICNVIDSLLKNSR